MPWLLWKTCLGPGWCSAEGWGAPLREEGWDGRLSVCFSIWWFHSGCTPKRLHMHGLSNRLHRVSLGTFPAVIMVKCLLTLVWLFFLSQRSCSPGFGTERVVEWREGENSLSKYRQGLKATKGKKCSLLGWKTMFRLVVALFREWSFDVLSSFWFC